MRLIDADALINHVVKKYRKTEKDYLLFFLVDVIFDIDEQPTVEAEPVRHGHWIECESENGIHFHKCSECGKRDMYQGTFTDWNKRGFSFYYKRLYCPVCGAKMDLEE